MGECPCFFGVGWSSPCLGCSGSGSDGDDDADDLVIA